MDRFKSFLASHFLTLLASYFEKSNSWIAQEFVFNPFVLVVINKTYPWLSKTLSNESTLSSKTMRRRINIKPNSKENRSNHRHS